MRNIKNIFRFVILIPIILQTTGCSKDFLEKPPTSNITDASFYKTDDQVLAGTALLYSQVWFDYNDKASYNFGDFRAGTAYSAYNDRNNVLFNTTPDIGQVRSAWSAFFNVVGQSNLAIRNINTYAGSGVSSSAKKQAIAEARFMRALAYRYLVMNFGDVPIITNNLVLLTDTTTHRNTVKSVWQFITNEMRAAEVDLPETPVTGRVSKWSAEGMLARFYLTRAGVESVGGVRNQTFLDSAKYYADRVIRLSGRQLLSDYASLFKFPYDNNSESLFELQWVWVQNGVYGIGNSAISQLCFSNSITSNGDGWGGDKSATWWMLSLYDGIAPNPNDADGAAADTSMKGNSPDTRLKATFMLPGFVYPEITQTVNGVNQALKFPLTNDDGRNFASIKKYICGQKSDMGGQGNQQDYPQDTYMMRLAEIYLIYAEAALGDAASTTDAQALAYFNAVHTRAGLSAVTDPLTFDMIFKERIKEFAMESMAWYDFVNLHYYNPQKAYSILNSQDRGVFNVKPDNIDNPTIWTFQKSPKYRADVRKVNAYDGNFLIPLPAAEVLQAPNLLKPAVDYYTGQ